MRGYYACRSVRFTREIDRMMNGGKEPESKDPAIKLFGKTIALPESQTPATSWEKSNSDCQIQEPEVKDRSSEVSKTVTEDTQLEDSAKSEKSSVLQDAKEEMIDAQKNPPKDGSDETNNSTSEDTKALKKPDKILPCPRCNSLDTKFCYFNNYNVNQPRHFCKNCQRYWTAGGTMRNVPVGAGRRKNKHLASQYRQIMVPSDGVPSAATLSCIEPQTSFAAATVSQKVLNFGSETPLCESIATINLKEQNLCVEIGRDSSCGFSSTTTSSGKSELPVGQGGNNPPQALHCYPVPPWVFPLCSSELVCVPGGSNPSQVQWCHAPVIAVPALNTPAVPLQFVPASYWGGVPVWGNGAGHLPMSGHNGCLSPSSSTSNSCGSGNGSPKLGKHSRDANITDDEKSEKCILIPKTLRIDDPDEASKSSIWAALGIKPGQKEPVSKGIFRAFVPKAEGNIKHSSESTHVLEANPAALTRSQTFQEST